MRRFLPWCALALAAPLHAAPLVLDCGQLFDARSGTLQRDQRVVVENGKFTAVARDAAVPAGAERMDLSQHTCLPGLIDLHVHLWSETSKQADAFRDSLSTNPADFAYRSVAYAERTLLAGFTTVRDLGASDGLNVSLKRAIAAGHIRGPRIFSAGKHIATTGGHADPSNSLSQKFSKALGTPGPMEGVVNGPEEARQAVRARYKEGADLIKITATGGVLSQAASGQNAQFSEEEVRAIVTTAKDYGFHVAAHAHGAEGLKRALRGGVTTIEHGTFMDDEAIALFKKTGAWYVPTITAGKFVGEKSKDADYYSPVVRPKAAAVGPQIQATFGRAYKAGVKIAFGTDAGVFPHGENAKEFAYMVEAGMPAAEAIRAATLSAAEVLGQSSSLGQIAPGYTADLVAVAGNPLTDVTVLQKMAFVMKDGAVALRP
jgi:imidazolonepropionase-like amidohydrolase